MLRLKTSEPRSGFKENRQYEEALHCGFKNPEIRTMALAGVYGSGKSSVLKSIKRRCIGKRKVRAISLLGFTNPENDGAINTHDTDLQTAIIKQLHDSARKSWVRGSRYSRVERNRPAGVAFFLVCWFLCGLLFHDQLYSFVLTCAKNMLGISRLDAHDTLLVGIPFTAFGCFVFAAIISLVAYYLLPHIRVTEISLFGCSLKMTPAKPDFSNSTDEIINIIERAKIGVLIFEDLDRFNDPRIYEQLYNLCTTINEYMRNNHPSTYARKWRVTFVFALRDDLLPNAKERTKLFDLYIPVNNPVSPNNAYERVAKIFDDYLATYGPRENNKKARKQIEEALSVVAKSTTDIRTINAIYNSALTLKRAFIEQGAKWPEDDKIIIASTLRQLFPEEYALEVEGKGFLDAVYEKCIDQKKLEFKRIQKTSYKVEDLIAQLESAIKEDTKDNYQNADIGDLGYVTIFDKDIPCDNDKVKYWRRIVNSGAGLEVTFTFQHRYASSISSTYTISRLKELGPYDALTEAILHSPEVARARDKTKKTGEDALRLYYDKARKETLEEYTTSQPLDNREQQNSGKLAEWLSERIKEEALDSSYPCYISPIVRQGESESLTTFRLFNIARGVADYTAPLSREDIDKLVSTESFRLMDKSSVALLNVFIIWHLLSQKDLELISEIFDWQVDHAEKLAEFYDIFCAWSVVVLGGPEDLDREKAHRTLLPVTTLLAERCSRERVLVTIANNQSFIPPGLTLDLVLAALAAQNGPLHLITGAPSSNDIIDLLDSFADGLVERGGADVANQVVRTFVQYGHIVEDGSIFAQYSDQLQVLVENGLLLPITLNMKYIPAEQHIKYLEKNLEKSLSSLDETDAQELLHMLHDEELTLTSNLVLIFVKALSKESGAKLIMSTNLENAELCKAVGNLDERFRQLCDTGGTVQFDCRTDSLMRLLRRLKDAGIVTRYWSDKRSSKLYASSQKNKNLDA